MFKIQYKIEGVFVDLNTNISTLQEAREYLDAIRQDGIIYRIFSVRYDKSPKKTTQKVKKIEIEKIEIEKIKIRTQQKVKRKDFKRVHP
jgi:hypothetical protein